ncbi:MAG: HlyD family efflux transporter periplasmic adaptor subunit [Woeseiaceae bacterium]|nr:HlyD family efflux transporter periplasmic adaptor subunit [Woeseiaceae bacterium]
MKRLVLLSLLLTGSAFAEQWSELEPVDRPITVSASGIVVSADSIRFGPPATRRWRVTITNLAREGSMVKAGDVLAQFDASSTDDRVRERKGQLNAKRSELESLLETQLREIEEEKVTLAEAKSAAEKAARKADTNAEVYAGLEYQKLLEERDIAADLYRRETERKDLNRRVRDAKKSELEADIRRLESEVAGSERELESFTIKAPRDGLVIVGTDQQGQKLSINDQTNPGITVVELANPDDLIVRAEVPEFAATSITVGQNAVSVIDAVGGTPISGKVIDVGSIVRRQSQFSQAMVRDVSVSLPQEVIETLRPGMSVKLEIEVDTQKNALAVPDDAIQYRAGKPGVVVRGDGWRPIVIGRASAGLHIVESGLEAGDKVALQ